MRTPRSGLTLLAAFAFSVFLPGPVSAAPEGTMTWGVHVTLASRWLDPAETEALVTPFLVLYALHDAVVKPMTGVVTGPSLAESWTVSRDGLVYEFVLRKHARFHNGDAVTADDVKFSFERYLIYLVSGPVAEELKRTPGFKVASPLPSIGQYWLDFPEQGNPKSPWRDQRVRLAATLAVDRKAVSEAEWLGFARPSGNIVPKALEFALELPPHPYDPARAKTLLAEAGYPGGFDGGDFTPFPPYNSMGEAIANYLRAVGIRTRFRTMERAAFLTAWREKKIPGVIMALVAPSGNAATRLEPFVTRDGFYSYSPSPKPRISTRANRASWTGRSARRCCIRSSDSSTTASPMRP